MTNKKPNISEGTLVYQDYKILIEKKIIYSKEVIPDSSIQPASIDLRLGNIAYEISSSFLSINQSVEEKLRRFQEKKINISNGFLFKKNITYLVELQEKLNLTKNLSGKSNPKSSTGRLDIFCRIITDYNSEYEVIRKGYRGKIYIEITSKTFDIIFSAGDKLNQLRLRNRDIIYLDDEQLYNIDSKNSFLHNIKNKPIKPLIKNGIRIKADISDKEEIIAFKAKKNSSKIFFNKFRFYKVEDFWISIKKTKYNCMIIEPNEFYILKSKEKICIHPNLAAEMIPYDTDIGEYRVHYAGFFDPGFGNKINGSHAVLEIKTYEVPFAIEDGQNIARLVFEKLAEVPNKLYGNTINSNYQNQGLALSKHFRVLD